MLKYRPLGLAHDGKDTIKVAAVVRDETEWVERDFKVETMEWKYLERLGQHDVKLELATWVEPINYRWELGTTLVAANG